MAGADRLDVPANRKWSKELPTSASSAPWRPTMFSRIFLLTKSGSLSPLAHSQNGQNLLGLLNMPFRAAVRGTPP